jgi:hypothetical protein
LGDDITFAVICGIKIKIPSIHISHLGGDKMDRTEFPGKEFAAEDRHASILIYGAPLHAPVKIFLSCRLRSCYILTTLNIVNTRSQTSVALKLVKNATYNMAQCLMLFTTENILRMSVSSN